MMLSSAPVVQSTKPQISSTLRKAAFSDRKNTNTHRPTLTLQHLSNLHNVVIQVNHKEYMIEVIQ